MGSLEWDDPNDPDRVKALRDVSSIGLTVDHRDSGYWLDCRDSGVGMTKAIITDHVLVGGSTRKREIVEQQRLCAEARFQMYRSGRFGIGVLSYFMIGSQIDPGALDQVRDEMYPLLPLPPGSLPRRSILSSSARGHGECVALST